VDEWMMGWKAHLERKKIVPDFGSQKL